MDSIKQQFNYGQTLLKFWGGQGPALWDFSGFSPDISVNIGNRYFGDAQVINMAVQAKRNAAYAQALGYYLHLMGAQVEQLGRIPINTIRGYFKVLICINEFDAAYKLISTLYCDAQNSYFANAQIKNMLQEDWITLTQLSMAIIDNGTGLYAAFSYAASFSGSSNYQFVKSEKSILQELKRVRMWAKQHGI